LRVGQRKIFNLAGEDKDEEDEIRYELLYID